MKTFAQLVCLVFLLSPSLCASPSGVEANIDAILASLTTQQKIALTAGLDNMNSRALKKQGIGLLRMTDGPHGVRWEQSTAFPTEIGLAASFDLDLVYRVGQALGRETLGHGRNVLLGPCVNIHRHPLGGRNFESFSEDPFLTSRMALAYIEGVQSSGAAATVKHFAANNQETLRTRINVKASERAYREIYFPAFEAAVKEAGVLAVMASYNKVQGYWAAENKWLLRDVLKGEWAFSGLVMSDWGATHSGRPSLTAGLDLEMPGPGQYLGPAYTQKSDSKNLDDAVRRYLRVQARLGLLNKKYKAPPGEVNSKRHQALARQAASAGMVLLKNEKGLLPLDKNKLKRIAVIGPLAKKWESGGGSSWVTPPYFVSPLDGLKKALGHKVKVHYEIGTQLEPNLNPVPASFLSNVSAQYFKGMDLAGPVIFQRDEALIDYNWKKGSPQKKIPVDGFSARWQGSLRVPQSGNYSLGVRGDDGYRLWLDNKLIVENWINHAAEARMKKVFLEKGKHYNFKLEFYEDGGDAAVRLGWVMPGADFISPALKAAREAELAVVVVGLGSGFEGEGHDRQNFKLPGKQAELIRRVAAVQPKTVVVLIQGSPVEMASWALKVPAIVTAWYSGMEGGNAIADVLLGKVNPSGKLPDTFPRALKDVASNVNWPGDKTTVEFSEGILVGYRHFDTAGIKPMYAFGHGLSYTQFSYSNLQVKVSKQASSDLKASVSLVLKNTGQRDGAEIVQLYVSDLKSSLPRPPKELKAFKKVFLKAGQSKIVTLVLNSRSFAFWNPLKKDWDIEAGAFKIKVGSGSRDIRLERQIDIR